MNTEDAKLIPIQKTLHRAEATLDELGAYESPFEKLEKGLRSYCEANKIAQVWTEGLAKFTATPDGAALKRAYDANPAAPAPVRPNPEPSSDAVEAEKRADAMVALEKGLVAFCKARNIDKPWTVGLEQYTKTAEGAALKRAVDKGR